MEYIVLVDCNNFFVSCERLVNPSLEDKPVCVLSYNDGCVIARSDEVKRLGIPMGAPYFMVKKQFREVVYLSSNLYLYRDISNRVMEILEGYAAEKEVYSIDEAFLRIKISDKTSGEKDIRVLLSKIKSEMRSKAGIPVSIGAASSKTLAKLACQRAKASNKGYYVIELEDIANELKMTDVSEIWGVGRKTAEAFRRYGIFKASDVLRQNDFWLRKIYGKRGAELKEELSGKAVYKIVSAPQMPKSIQKTNAFQGFSTDKNFIKKELYKHIHRACMKMRRLGLRCRDFGVILRTKDFKVFYKEEKLMTPLNSEFELYKVANRLLDVLFEDGVVYRASGAVLNRLVEKEVTQLGLFEPVDTLRSEKLSAVWDKLEGKYGKGVFSIGRL